jgi:2-succinyl-6-hydroxy-2,4-cyclohexadiene-1-carboxylate synthase
MPSTIVMVHGFAGTGRAWDPVIAELDGERYRALAPDLRGPDILACAAHVLDLAPDRFVLCGYSLGGRIALHAALAAPSRVARLVLVATTGGIDDPAERAARRAADEALAARVERGTIEEFADEWMAQPLFAGTPPAAARLWREDLLRNEPAAVAASLRALGTGVMTPVWDRLHELTMPATIVVGERDAKFRALGERLAAGLPAGQLVVVAGAGHGLPREAPRELAAILRAS